MSRLAVVVPIVPGKNSEALRLITAGPPFELEGTRFDHHAVYLTDTEAIFVFEAPGGSRALDLPGEDPDLWDTARAWRKIMAGRPRLAQTVFTWDRTESDAARR
ncbi:MAG TPA: hypothetical protein VHK22_05355 [Gaiellaceae bacterium]|nr:hypothetical protein [Gaiellaceae bacterium]